jgi:hypothetical protein
VIPDNNVRSTLFDWMAFNVQHPEEKLNWHPALGGLEGIGKDLLFYPVVRAIGQHNTAIVDPDQLDGQFNGYLANRKLLILGEMMSYRNKKLENKLKAYAASPPEVLTINPKGQPSYEIPNLVSIIAMTNHRSQGLTLSEHDRRWFPYWSPAKKETPAYYTRLWEFVSGAGGLAVWSWLGRRPLGHFSAKANAPDTAYKAELIEFSEHPTKAKLRDALEEGRAPLKDDVVLMQRVLDFLNEPRMDAGKVGGFLRELGCEKRRIQRRAGDKVENRRVWIVRDHARFNDMTDRDLMKIIDALESY